MLAYFYLITAASMKRMIHHRRTTAMTKEQCQHHKKLTTISIKVSLHVSFDHTDALLLDAETKPQRREHMSLLEN